MRKKAREAERDFENNEVILDESDNKDFLGLDGDIFGDKKSDGDYITELESEINHLKEQVSRALVQEDGVYKFRRFRMTRTALVPPDGITKLEANEFGYMLSGMDSALQFWMGDWANLYVTGIDDDLERSEIYDKLSKDFGIERKTLRDYASICRILDVNKDPSLRRDGLLFTHHKLIAYLPKELKGREIGFLDWAENEASKGNLSKATLSAKIADELRELVPSKRKKTRMSTALKTFKTITPLLELGDDTRLTKAKMKKFRNGIEKMRELLEEMEEKLDNSL